MKLSKAEFLWEMKVLGQTARVRKGRIGLFSKNTDELGGGKS